jgi:hypothetical protein
MQLPTDSGSGELPGMRLGRYRLRLADLAVVRTPFNRRGRVRVVAQRFAGIGVFGQVPFSALLGYQEHSLNTPSYSFRYVKDYVPGYPGHPSELFAVSNNYCLTAHVAFVEWLDDTENTQVTVTLVQEAREPVSATLPVNDIGTIDAELTPGQSWGVNASSAPATGSVYLNGYAVCDSTEPFHR